MTEQLSHCLQRWSLSERNSIHTSCASVLFDAATHLTVPPMRTHISANGSFDSQREIIYPFTLTGEQLYKLWFGQYFWTFSHFPPESCRSVNYQYVTNIQLWVKTHCCLQLSLYALQQTKNIQVLNRKCRKCKPGCCLPSVGSTFPVLLVSEPRDPSRHSVVVQSFWVMVGSSCSKPAFWL